MFVAFLDVCIPKEKKLQQKKKTNKNINILRYDCVYIFKSGS